MKFKEKPKMGKPKSRPPGVLGPKQSARMMKEKYLRELGQRPEGPETETGYATGQVESAGRWAADTVTDTARDRRPNQRRRSYIKEKAHPGEQAPQSPNAAPEGEGVPGGESPAQPRPDNAPKERQTVEGRAKGEGKGPGRAANAPKERAAANAIKQRPAQGKAAPPSSRLHAQAPGQVPIPSAGAGQQHAPVRSTRAGHPPVHTTLNNNRRGAPAALRKPPVATGPWSAQSAPRRGGRGPRSWDGPRSAGAIRHRPRAAFKTRAGLQTNAPIHANALKVRPAAKGATAQAARAAQQTAQRHMSRQMVQRARKAAKSTLAVMKKITLAVVKAAAALVGALAGLVGGGVLLVALVIIIVIAAVANSPFGLFFAAEPNAPDTVSVSQAVAQVNVAYNARLEDLQAGDYDDIVLHGQAPDWPDVLAVFGVKLTGADVGGMDVATLDADRVDKLTAVFWDMTAITTEVETIDHPGDGEDDPGWTEYILHITITPKTADDMRTAYAFTDYQNSALDELLADRAALSALAGSLTITSTDVLELLDALPDNLDPERRAAVATALSLVGKVNYFWSGKSYVIGWDSRWGQLTKVWAEGSSTTGAYRPFGLDCTGFLDWAFRNAGLHSDGHWYIGNNLTDVSFADALPGDIALFPDASHVGLVVGRSSDGGILVCHCSYSQNNVVVTDCAATGFTAIGRPDVFD